MVGKRLAQIRGNTSIGEFAEQLGVHRNTYRTWENERSDISADGLRALANLGWNPLWVLSGEGSPRLSPDTDPHMAGLFAAKLAGDEKAALEWQGNADRMNRAFGRGARAEAAAYEPEDFREFVFVPRLSLRLAAGGGQVVESEQIVGWMAFRRSYLQMIGVPTNAACLVRVKGDSMEPALADGDTVLLDTSDTNVTTKARTYAFRLSSTGELAVKTIRASEPETWHLTGADHWPAQVLIGDNRPVIVGRVRWSGRTWD